MIPWLPANYTCGLSLLVGFFYSKRLLLRYSNRPLFLQLCAWLPGFWMRVGLEFTSFWWKPPCYSYVNDVVFMLISSNLHKKRSEVSIKTGSAPASLSFGGRAARHTTVKWPIWRLRILLIPNFLVSLPHPATGHHSWETKLVCILANCGKSGLIRTRSIDSLSWGLIAFCFSGQDTA